MLLKGLRCHTSSTTPFAGTQIVLHANLVKGPHSYTSSNAQITSSRLVLYVSEGASLPYF
jgi:hypothetical protein